MSKSSVKQIIRKLGGPTVVGGWCGVTVQAVSQWSTIPVAHVLTIEAACEKKVSRHEMRPDVYPSEQKDTAA